MALSFVQLEVFLEKSSADGVFVFNSKGKVLHAINVDSVKNLSAMVSILIKMSDEFLEDAKYNPLQKISLHSSNGYFIAQRVGDDETLCVFTKNLDKIGIINLYLNKINA